MAKDKELTAEQKGIANDARKKLIDIFEMLENNGISYKKVVKFAEASYDVVSTGAIPEDNNGR